MTDADIQGLIDARNMAVRAVGKIEAEKNAAKRAAMSEIDARFDQGLNAAMRARTAAQEAYDDAEAARAATNPLVGRKVKRPATVGRFGDPGTPAAVGVIEVWTRDSARPASQRFTRYDPGKLVVRLLKKNGKPGTRVESVADYTGKLIGRWTLVEEEGK